MDVNQLTAIKIEEVRTQFGICAETVAEQLQINKSNYSKLENGKVEITLHKLKIIADVLKVPMSALLPTLSPSHLNVTNGDNSSISSIHGTQINHYTDPQMTQSIQDAIALLQQTLIKMQ